MGLIRGALIVLASTIFLFASLSAGIFLTIGSSLNYADVENKTIDLAGQISEELNIAQKIGGDLEIVQRYCSFNENYFFDAGEYHFRLSCSSISQGVPGIINNILRNFVSDAYYEEYNCKFWDCFDKYSLTFLISMKSQAYWYRLFYFSLTAFLISAAALFFLMEKRRHLPFLAGGLMILSAFVLLALNRLLTSLSNELVSEIIGIFFSKAASVFARMLIFAGVVLFAGLAIEFYRAGFKLYNLFSKMEESAKLKKIEKQQKTDKDKAEKSNKK